MTTETQAQAREALLPCPFCGRELLARWDGANPNARCATERCKGAQLPMLNLDIPSDIAAWNRRPHPDAPQLPTTEGIGSKSVGAPAATGEDVAELVAMLRQQADEIARDGHSGWGNTMLLAADRIAGLPALVAERDALAAEVERLRAEVAEGECAFLESWLMYAATPQGQSCCGNYLPYLGCCGEPVTDPPPTPDEVLNAMQIRLRELHEAQAAKAVK